MKSASRGLAKGVRATDAANSVAGIAIAEINTAMLFKSGYWPRQDAYDIAERTRQVDLFIATVFAEQKQDIIYGLMEKATRENKFDLYQKLNRNGLEFQDEETEEKAASYAFSYSDVRSRKAM